MPKSSTDRTNWFRYTARQLDPETGLYYYRARYYDPTIGRFLSEDPLGFGGGMNYYRYVKNAPVTWKDPSGFLPECSLDPKSRCAKLFQQVFHITPDQFNSDIKGIQWFYSPNANTFNNITVGFITGGESTTPISSLFAGSQKEAVTLRGGAYRPPPVILGPDWFLDTSTRQSGVKLHEAVHAITGWSDAQVFNVFSGYGLPRGAYDATGGFNTDEFTQWLLAGCPR